MLTELLLPRTDAGVAMQVTAVALALAVGLWLTRRYPDARLLVVGVGVVLVALVGLRAAH